MVHLRDLLENGDAHGNKVYDAGIINSFSIAHLPKDLPDQRRSALHGRRSTPGPVPRAQRRRRNSIKRTPDSWTNPLFCETGLAQHMGGVLAPNLRENNRYISEELASSEHNHVAQPELGIWERSRGNSNYGVDAGIGQNRRQSSQASSEGAPCELRKQHRASPIFRRNSGARITTKNQSQSALDEKDQKAKMAHTAMERQRRSRISTAIKRIAAFLEIHGSKVEILESAAGWIGDAKSKIPRPVTVSESEHRQQTLRSETPQVVEILLSDRMDECSESPSDREIQSTHVQGQMNTHTA